MNRNQSNPMGHVAQSGIMLPNANQREAFARMQDAARMEVVHSLILAVSGHLAHADYQLAVASTLPEADPLEKIQPARVSAATKAYVAALAPLLGIQLIERPAPPPPANPAP